MGELFIITSVLRVHESDWSKDGVRFYRARDIVSIFNNEYFEPLRIPHELYEKFLKKCGKIEAGNLLVTGVGTIGIPYLVKPNDEFYFKDGNIIWFKNSVLNGEFLYYSFQSKPIIEQIKASSGLGTVGTYTIESAKRTLIRYPNYRLQEKIGRFLSLIDERIRTQNKIIEKTKSLIKPLFDNLNIGSNREIHLNDIGKYYSADSIAWEAITDSGHPVIIYGQLFTDYKYVISNIVSKTQKALTTLTTPNDLLFPSSTTVDALSLISPASIKIPGVMIGGDMFGIRVSSEYDSDYLSFLINCSYKKEISKYAQGSTIIHLHYDDIKGFKIQVCDKKKQLEISKAMNLILKKIELEQEIIQKYKKQKQFFLSNLFI